LWSGVNCCTSRHSISVVVLNLQKSNTSFFLFQRSKDFFSFFFDFDF
jgi:hypothetical protein